MRQRRHEDGEQCGAPGDEYAVPKIGEEVCLGEQPPVGAECRMRRPEGWDGGQNLAIGLDRGQHHPQKREAAQEGQQRRKSVDGETAERGDGGVRGHRLSSRRKMRK